MCLFPPINSYTKKILHIFIMLFIGICFHFSLCSILHLSIYIFFISILGIKRTIALKSKSKAWARLAPRWENISPLTQEHTLEFLWGYKALGEDYLPVYNPLFHHLEKMSKNGKNHLEHVMLKLLVGISSYFFVGFFVKRLSTSTTSADDVLSLAIFFGAFDINIVTT